MASSLPSKSYARIAVSLALPDLIEVQLESFERLKREGLADLFHELSPIESYNKGMKLYFPSNTPESEGWGLTYWFGEPKHSLDECVERDLTYASPLYVSVLLAGPDVPEPIKQDIFLGDFPEMTEKGTFIINGTERVVVSQLIRSPGVYFEAPLDRSTGRPLAVAKLIPDRGAWMEFETRKSDYLTLRFNRKRTVPITIFLRALAAVQDGLPDSPLQTGSDEELLELFGDVDNNPDRMYIASTLYQEPEWDLSPERSQGAHSAPGQSISIAEAALLEFFKRMRPGDPATLDNAREFLEEQLFDQRHYDLERVGRYKLNQKLDLHSRVPISHRMITKWDIVRLVRRMIQINNGTSAPDDIDHLGNRRAKTVGELIQNKLRIGLRRMERVIKERMSIRDQDQLTPITLINIRPVVAALREFFGSSQLSQFMDQTNPLAELRHKRTLSALGPGGLRRERAGFDVRDVHHSHYGRICPIETPEGPNIGLIGRLASFARVNEYGFIETPYRRVRRSLPVGDPRLVGRLLAETLTEPDTGEVIAKEGERLTAETAGLIARRVGGQRAEVRVTPFVTEEMEYLSADVEDRFVIAQANTPLNASREFNRRRISSRYHSGFVFAAANNIDYMDVAPHQIVGISAALIPFLEHDDANRALMGSNMQAQAVPLLQPDVPVVSTGMEYHAAMDSGQVVIAEEDGEVISVTGSQIVVRPAVSRESTERVLSPSSTQSTSPSSPREYASKTTYSLSATPATRPQGANSAPDYPLSDEGVSTERVLSHTPRLAATLTTRLPDHIYHLRKYQRSNQSTCIDQRPAVVKGQRVKKNEVIADSSSTESGELALGQNVVVAFLSWEGANFEDAIVISEKLVQDDKFTSVHIEKYEVESRDTRLGPEEITRDIPNVGEDAIKDLDERGIIRIGAEVGPNDILVGKISPKGEKELTPEERLLRAIFGEKSRDVKDTSLRMPHGERGKVVDVKVFTREDNADLSAGVDMMVRVSVAQRRKITAGDKMAGRHGNKGVVSRVVPVEDMPFLENGNPVDIILNPTGVPGRMNLGQVLETHLGWAASRLGFRAITPVFDGATESEIEAELARAWLADRAWKEIGERAWAWLQEGDYDPRSLEDDDEVRRLYLEAWLGSPGRDDPGGSPPMDFAGSSHELSGSGVEAGRESTSYSTRTLSGKGQNAAGEDQNARENILTGYDVYRMIAEPQYARMSVLHEWLKEKGFDPARIGVYGRSEGVRVEDRESTLSVLSRPANPPGAFENVAPVGGPAAYMPSEGAEADAGDPAEAGRDEYAVQACLRLWLESVASLTGEQMSELTDQELRGAAEAVSLRLGLPVPTLGKQNLRDGKTGQSYDRPVTVGVMTMLKLHHLVEDKVHARSTGPYSLVSQQPLGGKAQFGGQRFGEMEVWALEAYGAAYTLQEMLTVKSDDVQGRVKTYEAIVKGESIEEPSIPASFRVLVKELQSLGLAVEAVTDTGEVIKFGKDEERARPPKVGTGLLSLGEEY